MPELPFNHPEARRKRAEQIRAEMDGVMLHFASKLAPRPPTVVEPPRPKVGTIYFIGPEAGPIKIGFASRLEFRLRDLQLANALPLIVHASVEGSPKLERDYHRWFAAHRLHGEWFEPHPDILAEIERLNA